MVPGRDICSVLKTIRREIARKNGIDLTIPQCTYDGPCTGTCPQCESEVKALEIALQNIPNPDLSGIGASACMDYDPNESPWYANNYLADYLETHGDNLQKIIELQQIKGKLQIELDALYQQSDSNNADSNIMKHEIGIRNLNQLIEKLRK
jgi:hypothetical protein